MPFELWQARKPVRCDFHAVENPRCKCTAKRAISLRRRTLGQCAPGIRPCNAAIFAMGATAGSGWAPVTERTPIPQTSGNRVCRAMGSSVARTVASRQSFQSAVDLRRKLNLPQPKVVDAPDEFLERVQLNGLAEVAARLELIAHVNVCFGVGSGQNHSRDRLQVGILLDESQNLAAVHSGHV